MAKIDVGAGSLPRCFDPAVQLFMRGLLSVQTLAIAVLVLILILSLVYVFRFSKKHGPEQSRLVIYDGAGRALQSNDLSGLTGTFRWEIHGSGDKPIPARAQELLKMGQQAGSNGQAEQALLFFARAHEAAPDWPYPLYESAYTHVLSGELTEAEHDYSKVEKLAPRGFFTYQAEVGCVRRELAAEFPAGTCKAYLVLADMPNSPDKRALLEALLGQAPSFAPAWEKLSLLVEDDPEKLRLVEKGLSCHPDLQTRGSLLISKALVLQRQGRQEEAILILEQLASDTNSPEDVELKSTFVLDSIRRNMQKPSTEHE